MESIDKLLADIKAEYQEKAKNVPGKPQPFSEPTTANKPISEAWQNPIYSVSKSSETDLLLEQIKSEYEQEQREEELKKQEEIRQEQIRQQQILQQQREAFKKQAEVWLKNLDPLSDEGMWFEELSFKYPSKLEAAIDYLQTLQNLKPSGG